jgi:hypothetical protein
VEPEAEMGVSPQGTNWSVTPFSKRTAASSKITVWAGFEGANDEKNIFEMGYELGTILVWFLVYFSWAYNSFG